MAKFSPKELKQIRRVSDTSSTEVQAQVNTEISALENRVVSLESQALLFIVALKAFVVTA